MKWREHDGGLIWFESAGGPVVLVNGKDVSAWFQDGTDSGIASTVEDVGIVTIDGRYSVLSMWDSPMSTTYDSVSDLIVQWGAADSEADMISLIREEVSSANWNLAGSLTLDSARIVDAASAGLSRLNDDSLDIPWGGQGEIEYAWLERGAEFARVVRFVPAQ